MSEKGDKCNYWAQEIGTQNGVIKFGALSPQGDVTCSVQIVGLDGRHFINMDEDGKRKGWTTVNAPGAFQINAGEDLIQINEGGGEGRKNKVEQNGIFINAENGDVTIRARNGKLRLEGLDIEMVATGNNPEGTFWLRANENIKLEKSGHELQPTHKLPSIFNNKGHFKKEENFDDIDNILKTLSELTLAGGETLAIPKYYELMDHIIGLGVSRNIKLIIITNATLVPTIDEMTILDYIPYFKSVNFLVSIEFWGEKNDYLRYGSKWQDIVNNVKLFKEHGGNICWNPTISALNIGYLNEVPEDENYSFINMVDDAEIYSIKSIPPDIKEMYLEKNNPANIDNLIRNTVWDEDKMKAMLLDISVRDKLRNTNFIDIFPEWSPYIDD